MAKSTANYWNPLLAEHKALWETLDDCDGMLQQLFADNGATLKSWQIEQPRGGYPLAIVAGSDVQNTWSATAPAVLSVDVETASGHWLAARPLL